MKIRNGFVSNSSSSSFVCDVCGNIESGMDACLSDFDMVELSCEHVMCERHINLTQDDIEENVNLYLDSQIKYFNEIIQNKDLKDKTSYIQSLNYYEEQKQQIIDGELDPDSVDIDGYIDEKFCPLCNMSVVDDSTVLRYLLKQHNLKQEDVVAEIKSKYTNMTDFYNEN